ncbi:MAG: arginine--tRNA ligase [Gammaproteobacteria bacterium]
MADNGQLTTGNCYNSRPTLILMRTEDCPSRYRETLARAFARVCSPPLSAPPPVAKPRDGANGDLATPAALMVAKLSGEKPIDAARRILAAAEMPGFVAAAEVAGAGFINIRLKAEAKAAVVAEVLHCGDDFGRGDSDDSVLLEFVSANPTGPLHIGHGRAAAFGDALANILAFDGAKVWREYYLNDAGKQISILAASAWLRCHLPPDAEMPPGSYRGEYLLDAVALLQKEGLPKPGAEEISALLSTMAKAENTDIAADMLAMAAKECFADGDAFGKWSGAVVAAMKKSIVEDLRNMGVGDFDKWFSERDDLGGTIESTLAKLPPEMVYEKDGALWFGSSADGDDKDRVLRRQNGEYTYFAADIAYHRDKLERAPNARLINILGADHHGYVPRLSAAVRALGGGACLETPLIQFVALLDKDGGRVKMSTRGGEFVALSEFVGVVGRDAARYFFVCRKNDQHLDVNVDLARAKSKNNPSFYIQYAHARLCRLCKRGAENDDGFMTAQNFDAAALAGEESALALCERMMAFADVVNRAAASRAPHTLAAYVLDFAAAANHYYEKAENILRDDNAGRKKARLALLFAARIVLASGIRLLGMEAREEV